MAAPTSSGESDMANEDIFSNLSPLRSPRCILPLRSTPSPPRHFLPSSTSMVVSYQGSTSGTSDEAIEEFDVTICFNIPSSPAHIPTLSLQRPFLPSSNSMVVYQPSNHSMENLPQNQLQDPYTFLQQLLQLQLLQLQQRWIFLLPNKVKLSLLQQQPPPVQVLRLPLQVQMLLLRLQAQELRLQSMLPELQHIFLLPKQMQEPRLKQCTLSLLNLQVNLQRLFSQSKQMKPPLEQILLSLNNPPNLSEATVDDEIGIGGVGTWDCEMEKVQTQGGESENKRTDGVRIAIPLEDIPQTKGVCLKDAAMNLNVSQSTLLNPDTLPYDQTLAAIIDTNNTVVKETVSLLFLPTAQQENLDEDFGNGVEAVGMGSERTGDSETEDEFNLVSRSRQLNPDTLPSDQASTATIDTNSAVVKEIVSPLLLPTTQQENLDEDFGNGVEAVGMGSERTEESEREDEFNTVSRSTNGQLNSRNLGKRKREKMTPRGERRNKKTNGVRIAIPLEDILQTKKMLLKDAAKHLKVSIAELRSSYQEYEIPRWPPRNEHKLIRESFPNETPAVVDQEGFSQLTSHNGPSDQALRATVDTNGVDKEIPLSQFLPTTQQENPNASFGNDVAEAIGMGSEGTREGVMEEGQLNSGCSRKKGKRKVNTPGVRIEITMEDILKVKGMCQNEAAEHLEVSRSTLKRVCREYGIKRWPPRKKHELIGQTRPNESPAVEHKLNNQTRPNESFAVEHELISQTRPKESPAVDHELISQTRPKESPAAVDQEQTPQLNSDTVLPSNYPRKEHELISQTCPNESPAVLDLEQTPQLNSGTVLPSNHPRKEHELISQTRPNKSPAVVDQKQSTPQLNSGTVLSSNQPRKEHELISQACPNESPAIVDQEQTPQLNSDMVLPSNQVLTAIDTKSVKLKARYEGSTITFRLSRPLQKVELEQEVKKRLPLEAGTYNISYKDEDDDLVLIACDDDLEECISSSTPLGSRCQELFLTPK